MFGRVEEKTPSSTLAMRYVDALREKGELPSRAILEAVPSAWEWQPVYRETLPRIFQVVLLSNYVGHRKNKGVVLREEEENRGEDSRTERGKGEEALAATVAQDDADPRRWRRAEASAEVADESVGDAGSRRGGRGRDERDEHENRRREGQGTKS
jgi:hypothetical protein